jgi:subtilisin family serine protease
MNAITKDEFSYYQYYLTGLNILNAQDKLPDKKNEVIIAVIDDGVNVNHPDLQ